MQCNVQRIGEYILVRQIGAGASGKVWLAHHHVWADRFVAVKILANPGHIRDLQRQELVAKNLFHPGIVRLIGVDPYFDPPYIVIEYVLGTSLRPWIESASLLPRDAVKVTIRILEALAYAHAHNVFHGDVKPENIMIDERALDRGLDAEGMIKLTDFCLGERSNQTADSIIISTSLNADAFRQLGTIDYMSPEQRQGREIDARTDIYACGVMLYEMLTGSKPVGLETPSEFNTRVPIYLDKVVRRAYARLEKRYESAEEFLDALDQRKPAAPRPFEPPIQCRTPTPAEVVDESPFGDFGEPRMGEPAEAPIQYPFSTPPEEVDEWPFGDFSEPIAGERAGTLKRKSETKVIAAVDDDGGWDLLGPDCEPPDESDNCIIDENALVPQWQNARATKAARTNDTYPAVSTEDLLALGRAVRRHSFSPTGDVGKRRIPLSSKTRGTPGQDRLPQLVGAGAVIAGAVVGVLWADLNNHPTLAPLGMLVGGLLGAMLTGGRGLRLPPPVTGKRGNVVFWINVIWLSFLAILGLWVCSQ